MGPMIAIVYFSLCVLFPVCLIVFNRRFSNKEKLVGAFASLFFSWVGFVAFYVLAVLTSAQQTSVKRSAS
jgi:hypothetical protein